MTRTEIIPDLTIDEAAAELAVSRMHVYRMIGLDKLYAYKVGKNTRIPRASLDAFKTNNPWKDKRTRYGIKKHAPAA